jgi:hypothetical protein
MLQAGRLRVQFLMMSLNFFDLPGVYSASNRNKCQKQTKKIFLVSKAQPLRVADNLIAICETIV